MRKFDLGSGSRREFLKTGLRAGVFGGLVLTGTLLGLRTPSRRGDSPACLIDLPCRSCRQLSGCAEPRAARFRINSSSHAAGSGLQDEGSGRD
jgi:hypothetical protein